MTPEGWTKESLLKVASITNGQVDPKLPEYCNMTLIAPNHIEIGTGRIIERSTAKDQGAISGKFLVGPDEVIYSKIRPYLMKATIPNEKVLCSADMYPLKAGDDLDNRFLLYLVLSHHFTHYVNSVSGRTGIPKINREELSGYHFNLPPLKEQQRISKILFTWDQAIRSLDQLIDKNKKQYKWLIRNIFKLSKKWPRVELKEIAEVISGQSPKSKYYNKDGKGLPLYQGKTEFTNIYIGKPVTWTDKITKIAKPNDILMSVRAPVGPVNISTEKICIGRGLAAIRNKNEVDMKFLFYFLKSISNQMKGIGGSVFDSINQKQIKKISVPLPPHEIQKKIILPVITLEKSVQTLEIIKRRYEKQKKGLMQKLLSGQLRVKV